MISEDQDALDCDFMEYYGIIDRDALSLKKQAVFAYGLPSGSRIKMKMSGANYPEWEYLLAACLDRLSFLAWAQSEDGQKGRNRPKSIVEQMSNMDDDNSDETMGFDSVEAFKKIRYGEGGN